jgi:hypothetical protein
VIAAGFEPATRSLEGCCSIQLSYATIFRAAKIEKYPLLNANFAVENRSI